jgi:filamentous hemagglutinin
MVTGAVTGYLIAKGVSQSWAIADASALPPNGAGGRVSLLNGWSVDMEAGGASQYDQYKLPAGGWDWPKNNGAVINTTSNYTLSAGEIVDRIGQPYGSYLSPVGTSLTGRALAPGSFADPYSQYIVLKPFTVEQSVVAPAFGENGNGLQYRIPGNGNGSVSVQDLIQNGYLGVKQK